MNRNDLAVIALRVLAIYWALQIIPVFPSIYFAREPWLIALNVLLLVVRVACSFGTCAFKTPRATVWSVRLQVCI